MSRKNSKNRVVAWTNEHSCEAGEHGGKQGYFAFSHTIGCKCTMRYFKSIDGEHYFVARGKICGDKNCKFSIKGFKVASQ